MRAEDGLRNGRVVIFPYEGRGIGELGFVLDEAQEESLRRLLNERYRSKQNPDIRKTAIKKAAE